MGMMKKLSRFLGKASWLSDKRKIEWFPPFFLMRAKVLELDEEWNHVRVLLPLTWASANGTGNMFGGQMASLADPIPALACNKKFPGYRVATKNLNIRFIRVGNSDLTLHFDFPEAQIEEIQKTLEEQGRADPEFQMTLVRADGEVCAHISNTVAMRPRGYISRYEGKAQESPTDQPGV